MDDSKFKWAAEYAALGWHIVVCHGANGRVCTCRLGKDCATPGKHPVLGAWQSKSTIDEDELADWYDGEKNRNIGVQLGEKSGIIDIEFDSDEGRKSAERYGLEKVYTPTFTSKRSTHRIFKYDSRLPQQAVVHLDGLEIRIGGGGNGAQSIMPPSSHASGASYAWVEGMSHSEVEPAEIPRELMVAIANIAAEGGTSGSKKPAMSIVHTKAGEGDRHHSLVRMAAFQCIKMLNPHDPEEQQIVLMQLHAINQTQCVPPKSREEVDTIFNSQLRWAIAERIKSGIETDDEKTDAVKKKFSEKAGEGFAQNKAFTSTGLEFRDGEWFPGEWKLTVIHGDPPEYVLRIPIYRAVDGRESKVIAEVHLNAETYRSSAKVAQAILEATHNVIVDAVPEEWAVMWNGRGKRRSEPAIRGLKAKLMDTAAEEAATPENCRFVMVAGWLLDVLTAVPKPDEEDDEAREPDVTGYPAWVRGPDGAWELWFGWSRAWEIVDRGRRKLEDSDRLRCKKILESATGGKLPSSRGPGEGGRSRRFTRLTEEHMRALERIAMGEIQGSTTNIAHAEQGGVAQKSLEKWKSGFDDLSR